MLPYVESFNTIVGETSLVARKLVINVTRWCSIHRRIAMNVHIRFNAASSTDSSDG